MVRNVPGRVPFGTFNHAKLVVRNVSGRRCSRGRERSREMSNVTALLFHPDDAAGAARAANFLAFGIEEANAGNEDFSKFAVLSAFNAPGLVERLGYLQTPPMVLDTIVVVHDHGEYGLAIDCLGIDFLDDFVTNASLLQNEPLAKLGKRFFETFWRDLIAGGTQLV